jgi:transmembrane sensor
MAHTHKIDERIEDQAAEWADALHQSGDDPAVRREFERWRDGDPARAETYARIDRGYRVTRAIEGSEAQRALAREAHARIARRQRRQRRQRFTAVAAGLFAVVVAGALVNENVRQELQFQQARLLHALAGESLYRTALGERRTVELADGSAVTLNTDSRAVVAYGDGVRGVTLARGQALFEVVRDPERPFVVTAGERKVTALGTRFDVRLTGERLEVTLIEGSVKVEEGSKPEPAAPESQATSHKPQTTRTTNNKQQTTVLHPGEQLIVTAALAKPMIRQADIRRAISWRDGLLLFEDDNLASAISEVNRYGPRRIVLADDSLRDLRISGAFRTGKPESFLETVSLYLPIRIVESTDHRILVGRRG